jgi:hypothetical protein
MYAKETSVPVERTRIEIERTLARYKATSFAYGHEGDRAMIGFAVATKDNASLRVRMTLPLPLRSKYPSDAKHAQALRSRWRALAMIVKAKLEAVESGISTVEREFMADVMLPNGRTLGETVLPQVPELYQSRGTPRLLPAAPGDRE